MTHPNDPRSYKTRAKIFCKIQDKDLNIEKSVLYLYKFEILLLFHISITLWFKNRQIKPLKWLHNTGKESQDQGLTYKQ